MWNRNTGCVEPSIHPSMFIGGIKIQGLVDKGATTNFLQVSLVQALVFSSQCEENNKHAVLGGGRKTGLERDLWLFLQVKGVVQWEQFTVID